MLLSQNKYALKSKQWNFCASNMSLIVVNNNEVSVLLKCHLIVEKNYEVSVLLKCQLIVVNNNEISVLLKWKLNCR